MTSSHCFTAPQITRLSTKKFRVLLKEFSTTHELDWCIFTASKKMNWINFQTNLSSWQLFGLGTVWIKIDAILCCNRIPDNLSPQQFFPPSLQYNHILPCVSNDIFWGGCGGPGLPKTWSLSLFLPNAQPKNCSYNPGEKVLSTHFTKAWSCICFLSNNYYWNLYKKVALIFALGKGATLKKNPNKQSLHSSTFDSTWSKSCALLRYVILHWI